MGQPSLNADARLIVEGQVMTFPVEWRDTTILASFNSQEQQGSIETDTFTLVGDLYQLARTRLESNQSARGLSFRWEVFNTNNQIEAVSGYFDLANAEHLPHIQEIKCPIVNNDSAEALQRQIDGIVLPFLVQQGHINEADFINLISVVAPEVSPLEALTLVTSLIAVGEAVQSSIDNTASALASLSGELAGGVSGISGAAIIAAIEVLLNLAQATATILAAVTIANSVRRALIKPTRIQKIVRLTTILRGIASYLGLEIESTFYIDSRIAIKPSNFSTDKSDNFGFLGQLGQITNAIPNPQDFGYSVSEIIQFMVLEFQCEIGIFGNKLRFYDSGADSFTPPVLGPDSIVPNVSTDSISDYTVFDAWERSETTNNILSSRLITYTTDIRNDYTTDNYEGNAIQIFTNFEDPDNVESNAITGSEIHRIPFCLGTRYGRGNVIERLLIEFFNAVRSLINVLPIPGDLTTISPQQRENALVMSDTVTSAPMLLVVDEVAFSGTFGSGVNGPFYGLRENHRSTIDAPAVWRNNYSPKLSFVNGIGQRKPVTIRSPFGMRDYIRLIRNNRCQDAEGREVRIIGFPWSFASDNAVINYELVENHQDGLVETEIIPS